MYIRGDFNAILSAAAPIRHISIRFAHGNPEHVDVYEYAMITRAIYL